MATVVTPPAASSGAGTWYSGTLTTNPSDAAVLVDTGALAAGKYFLVVSAWASVAAAYDVQHRNAANSATNKSQRRAVAANGNDDLVLGTLTLVASERLRVAQAGALTGVIQVSLFVQPV